MTFAPERAGEPASSVPPRRRFSPRVLGFLIAAGVIVALGVGVVADILATAPLRPPTQAGATRQAGLLTVQLTMSPQPLMAGAETTFTIRITDATGAPLTGAHVVCAFTMPSMSMPPQIITASPVASGAYSCRRALGVSGAWSLTVNLTPAGSSRVHVTFPLQAG